MVRVHNFSAGPAILPEEVLLEAAEEMLDFSGAGMSVMEMSHRSKAFEGILNETKENIRKLAGIPMDYDILFLQGGATTQFSMVPLNLLKNGTADYILTGNWAEKAAQEAGNFNDVKVPLSSKDENYSRIPDMKGYAPTDSADYVHICENNTIYGTQFKELPDTGKVPLVADQSSCIFSRPFDIRRYGLIYAGAQKNIGPAGLTLIIIRKDLIREELPGRVPLMLRYAVHQKSDSMHNTPPTYAIYITGKVIKWLLKNGGLEGAKERNEKKAGLLYDTLDQSSLFRGTCEKASRSLMNVTFTSGDEDRDAAFIKGAAALNISGIKGYRTAGGMRASIYNAMPYESVKVLCDYMKEFERTR